MQLKLKLSTFANSKIFEKLITITILVNCFFIGVETYTENSLVKFIQNTCLLIFVIEVILRYTASKDLKSYFSSGWNIFDLSIVLVCIIPESLFGNTALASTLRILRVFRIIKLFRTNDEIQLLVTVLSKSVRTLFYNLVIFLIFLYLFAVIGVEIFKLPDFDDLNSQDRIEYSAFIDEFPNAPSFSPDPYSDLGETTFTLFRILTGEDWTDIRYRLIRANDLGLIKVNNITITWYHVLWYIISAFLLLNLLIGAILTNYQHEIQKKYAGVEENGSK